MTNVAYGCCVGSWEKFTKNVLPHAAGQPVTGMSGQVSIAAAYNSILDSYPWHETDMLILQHDDLEITDPNAVEKFREAFAGPEVALVGVAGGGAGNGLAWWTDSPIGHVLADAGMVDFGTHSGEAALLEGCLLVFSRWAIENLRFTDRPGFHGYDCDISMAARAAGKKVVVVDVDVHHHTTLGFGSESSHLDWLAADQDFRKKWINA